MFNGTPGPWTIRYAKNLTAIVTPKGEMQLSLFGVFDGLKPLRCDLYEWQANAKLIAAAPELLQAAKCALADLDGIMPNFDPDGEVDDGDELTSESHPGWQTIRELEAVITKIEGEAR